MVEKFVWDQERYGIGNPVIDQQHREVLDIVNQVIDAQEEKDDDGAIEVLMRMNEYASYHFSTEEDMLQVVDFPELEAHRKLHADFTEQVSQFMIAATQGDLILGEILQYLRGWWEEHILDEDQQFRGYLSDNG